LHPQDRIIGKSSPRIDALDKVTGLACFPGDLNMPGVLHMKILFSGRPHARILDLDVSEAESYPGVVAVFTAKDVPVNEYGLQQPDQPVLCGPGSDRAGANVVRFVGDQMALIVAESEEAAAQARALIQVEFSDLPVVTDPLAAMQPGAPLVHPDRGDSNVCVHYKIRKGDWESAFAQADVILESEYHLPFQEHAYLQPEAGLAYIDEEGRVTVQCAGQWPHTDRSQISHSLGLSEEQVRVIYPAIGGAFGGREDMSVQIVLALAAWKLQRPVKVIWSRRESILGHCKRYPVTIKAKWGATRKGKLVAAEQVQALLEAAMAAPSANDLRPWDFVVVRDAERRKALAKVHQWSSMCADAPVVIVVVGNPETSQHWVEDCSAATENLLLAAFGLDLGSVWVAVYPNPEREKRVREILNLPEKLRSLCMLPVGHPAEQKPARTRFEGNKVHLETFGGT
jgi:xanthine dehydrogenase molybdopterin-binding subunit B